MKQIISLLFLIALASCTDMTTSENINVEPPATKPSNVDTNDSTFLKINITGENYAISFLKETDVTNHITELETFLEKNKDRINKDKVVVTGLADSKNKQNILDLLARYGVTRFHHNSN